jgi:hypothetical protein
MKDSLSQEDSHIHEYRLLLKKTALSKDEIRKKNYIGDAIIAEREENDELVDETLASQRQNEEHKRP